MDGSGEEALYIPSGGSLRPASAESVAAREHYVVQDGPAVFKAAVTGMAEVTETILKRNALGCDDIAWLVPHQANRRIIEAVAKRVGIDLGRVVINLDRYGNTVAGTIPLGLAELDQRGRVAYGDRVVLSSFGAGFTSGAVYLRWALGRP
jgi:3-oxoacyl-[acyl-carrier-protein] synthase III